jgi:lysophospholipase L1-like esterase
MFKAVQTYRRIGVSLVIACFLLLSCVPVALAASSVQTPSLIGPKQHYLALGDSLAFGFQPNGDYTHGYVNDFFNNDLKEDGVQDFTNLGCPGETSTSFIKGGCPAAPTSPPQLQLALGYLQAHAGQVSPVTLDIGSNDTLRDVNPSTCAINTTQFKADLATLNTNLTQIILPHLKAALTVNGKVTGQIVMLNYYDAFQNICPNTVPFVQQLNKNLKHDVRGFGTIVNVFKAFGGAKVPNPNICTYTWTCFSPPDIHPTSKGYQVIANALDEHTEY